MGISPILAQTPTVSRNFVMETVLKVPGKTTTASLAGLPVEQANRNISYLDGLGRPLQAVQWQASPGKKDIVSHSVYDGLGRETKKYLPYAEQASSDGSIKTDPLGNQSSFYGTSGWDANVVKTPYPYSQSVLEASPLNRVLQQGAPGATWQPYAPLISGSGHTLRPGYGSNASGEVPLWTTSGSGAGTNGSYAAGKLYKAISRDENWTSGKIGTTEEFKDLEGRVVMKRVWETESVSLSTHYVYDIYGNLAYVVPPAVPATSFSEASDANFSNYIYAYHYDGRRRLVEKKVPGKGWEFMVYNKLDQLVLSQDAVQRGNNQWSYSKYDALGRVIITGLYTNAAGRAVVQTTVDASTVLWEQRYNAGGSGYTNVSFPTVPDYYHSINYYDDYDFYNNTFGQPNGTTEVSSARTRGLPTGTLITTLGTGTMLLTVMYYDLDGRVVATKSQNHLGGTDVVSNAYDFAGQLLTNTRIHVANGATTTVYNAFTYDHMGRKISTRENINSQGEVTLNRLEYNEIGQLRKKNLHSTDGSNFYQHTTFGYNERGWMKNSTSDQFSMQLDYQDGSYPQYNGNISGQRWGSSLGNVYTYQYDRLNRLINGTSTGVAMSEVLTYDVMGNITSLNRDGTGTPAYGYTGNRLDYVWGITGYYYYDANGNATTDGRTGVTLTYNHLNLPITASKAGFSLAYTYDATGQKLRKLNATTSTTTDYVDGIQYTNGGIDFIQTEEGRAVNNSGTYKYEYNLNDHLGNVRYSFDIYAGAVRKLQEDDYYAFGKRRAVTGGGNNYLYNGKELQDELGQYDYGARFYDPVIGRWNVVDPLADHSVDLTPYHFCSNNPMNRIDPDGMCDKPNCQHKKSTREEIPIENQGGDQQGYLRNAPNWLKEQQPIKAGLIDLTQDLLDLFGANAVDNLFFSGEKVSWGNAALAMVAVVQGLETVSGFRGGVGKPIKEPILEQKLIGPAGDPGATGVKQKLIGPAGDPGATVTNQVPKEWTMKTSKNGEGTIFKDPINPYGNHVRVQSGNPNSPNLSQQMPYVKQSLNGKSIDANGREISTKAPESHIPRQNFVFRN
jgi:RHS repeat-associated protein